MTFAPEKGTKLGKREEAPPNNCQERTALMRQAEGELLIPAGEREDPLFPKEMGERGTGSSWWPAKMSQVMSAGFNTAYPSDRSALSKQQLCTESSSVLNVKGKDPGVNDPLSPGSPDKLGCPFKQLCIFLTTLPRLGSPLGSPALGGTRAGAALPAEEAQALAGSTRGFIHVCVVM